jgi:hypothetical protein
MRKEQHTAWTTELQLGDSDGYLYDIKVHSDN